MANGNGTLNHAETIQALTEFNNPPNGNGQNTVVTPSRHDISKARTLENKALAIQKLQQAETLRQANEAFNKTLSTIPQISLPDSGFQFREEPSTEELPTVDLPTAPTKEDMLKPLGPQPPDPALVQLADQAALTNNVPQAIFKQLIEQESSWNPRAKSNAGAMGLGQFMPDTATKDMGLTLDEEGGPGSVWHPESNLNASAKYLRAGFDRYIKQGFSPTEAWKISAAAYNAGMGNITNAMKRVSGPVKSWEQIAAVLPQVTGKDNSTQTIDYVDKLTGSITSSITDTADIERQNIERTKRQEELVPDEPGALAKLSDSITNFSKSLIQATNKAELNITEFAKSVIKKHGKKLGISWDSNKPDNSEGNRKAVEQWVENYGPEFGVSLKYPDTSIDAEKQHELAVQAERLLEFKKKMQDSTLNRPQIVALGHELAAPSKEPAKSQIGTPTERADAADLAAQDKENDTARLRALQDTAKFQSDRTILDVVGDAYNKAGDLANKAYDAVVGSSLVESEEEAITRQIEPRRPPTKGPDQAIDVIEQSITGDTYSDPLDIGGIDSGLGDLSSSLDSLDDALGPTTLEGSAEKVTRGPEFTEPSKIKRQHGRVIEYEDGSWGVKGFGGSSDLVGLKKYDALAIAAFEAANFKGVREGAPQPGTIGAVTNQTIASLITPVASVFQGFTGPTTLTELADDNDLTPEDVQRYKAIQKSTTLSAEQQRFINSENYKLLARLDLKAKENQKESDWIEEFAEEQKGKWPVNRENMAGATAAYKAIAESKGALEALIYTLKNDKSAMAAHGWDSVGYTIALTAGSIPVQLGMFVALANGMAQDSIREWKQKHKGKEPSAEVIRDIKMLSAARLVVEKASAGLLTKYIGQIPGLGGTVIWAKKTQEAIAKTVNPTVRELSGFTGKYVITPTAKTIKAMGAEGLQELTDEYISGVALKDPENLEGRSRWTANPSDLGLSFVLGSFGIFSTGAGVKAVDLTTKTAIGIGSVITSESKAAQHNRLWAIKLDTEIENITSKLQKIENYKKTDPKIAKELETINAEIRDLSDIDREGAEIGPNGELVTDSTYIKENFLALSLQIERGELTPQEALERVVSDLEAELSSKMETRDNLASQIPKALTFGETAAGLTDIGTLKSALADIKALEQETELSEEQEAQLSGLRKEAERLRNKLKQPANPEITETEVAGLKAALKEVTEFRDTKAYEVNWRNEPISQLKEKTKEKVKKDNTITDEKFEEGLKGVGVVDGAITLEMKVPQGEMEVETGDLNYANFDPSGEWRVGDIVTIKGSKDPKIQEAQGFTIEYILAEQVRDGKIHVKLKGLSETVPIDQLEEVVERTDRSPETPAERLEVLSKKDLTDEQRTKLLAAYGKEIDALKKKLNIKVQKLGSIESFENIDKESDDSVDKKANDSSLPPAKQQFYKDVVALRKAKAIRAQQESLNPKLKTLAGVHGEILQGESKQWKGLYSYYTDLVNAYTKFKGDKVLRDQSVDTILSRMETHSTNLNKKLDKFKEARSIMGTVPPGKVAAVVGTSTRTDSGMRTMRYNVVTNMTEAEVKAEQDKGKFITQIDQNSDSLIRTLEQEATYGNYIMGVVRGYEKSPMKGQVSDQELSIEKHEEVLRKLTQARDGIERVIKPISKETIKGIGVPKGEEAPPTGEAAPPTLDKQLEDTVKRANELADKKGKTKEEWNELNKLGIKMRSLNEQIEKRDAEGREPEGEDIPPEGPPPVSDEAPPVVRTPSEQEAREQGEADTFIGPKPLQTFIEGATQIYRNVVGRALDIVLGLAGATFADLIQIGPLKKVKGINTLQDIDFNNDKTLTAALIDLGVKPETASVLVGAFNSFKARYDNIIHDEIRFDDEVFLVEDGKTVSDTLYTIVDGGLHVEKGGAYNVKGDYTKIIDADKNEKVVLTSELVNARVDALNKPLSLLLRDDPKNPKNTQGRLPDQIVFTMMLSNLIFRQQTPNNNRWGDKDFAKQSFLFGGDNKTLNDTEEGEVSELGYGYHDTGADQGANIIALMDFSSKKIAKDHPHITQAGADAYFDSLGPGLGMMAMEIANGADMLFTIETHIWNFGNYDPERTYNDTKDITEEDIRDPETYGYKHLKVNPGVYKQFADKFKKPLKNIIEVVGANIDPSAGPLQKPPAVSTSIRGTFSSIFEEGEVFSALRKLQNAKWEKNATMDTVSDLQDYKAMLYELMDIESEHETEMKDGKLQWKLDSENKKIPLHHDKKMKSIKSSNKDKRDVLDELLAANTREELNEFYFKYELQNHHRLMMTGRVNPQQSKVARFLLKSWKAQKYNKNNIGQFKLAIAQNFGEKVDKKEFNDTLADFNTITSNENVLTAINALTRLNSAKERNSAKDKKQAAKDLATAMSAVKKDFPKGNISLLHAVTALSQYMSVNAIKTTKDGTPDKRFKNNFKSEINSSFESDVVFQIDGIANGWAMNVLQFPMWEGDELVRKLAQVANYFGKNNQHDLEQIGAYEELVKLVRDAEKLGNGYSVAWKYYQKNYRNKKYPKLADSYLNDQGEPDFNKFANQYKLLNSSLNALYPALKDDEAMRDVLKYPFMMKMYGGGMKRISGDVSTDIIKDIYSQIGDMQRVYNELQKSKPDPKIVKQFKAEYDITVENIDREVESFGNSLKHLGGIAEADEFISAIKSNTARNLKINDQTLHAKISTTIAPRIDYGLNELLGSSVIAPRTSVIQMGEMLHGVFITHYERAYKDKLAEVNAEYEEKSALKDDLEGLVDLALGQDELEFYYKSTGQTYVVTRDNKIFNAKNRKREIFKKENESRKQVLDYAKELSKSERANRTELTSREIRDLIQDTTGDLIKVYPQFAGPLSSLAKNGSFYEGFVDLAKSKRVRKEKDFTDTGIQESKVSVFLKGKDGKRTERLTTTAQLQFIEPGVSALIRQIINMDAAILTQTVNGDPNLKLGKKFRLKDKGQLWQGDANLLLLHDAAMGTPGQLIPFGKNYNGNYMQFNKDNSIIEKTFDQLEKVLKITEILDNADITALQKSDKKEDKKTLEDIREGEARTKEGLVTIREIKKLHKKAIGLYRDEDSYEREAIEKQISELGKKLTRFAKQHGLDYDKLKMEYNNARTTATPTRMDEIKKFIFNESRDNKFKENWRERKTLDDLVAQNKAVKNNVLKFREQLNQTVSKKGGMESFQMYMPPGSLNDNGTIYKAEKAKVNESVRKARKKKEKKPKAPEPPTTKPLNIWAGAGQNTILSNLANRPFTYEEKKYKSVEHAYQTLKSGEFDAGIYNKRWGFNNKIRNPKPAKTDNRYNIKLMEKLIEASLSAQSKESIAARDALKESIGRTITHTGGRQDIWVSEFPRILTKLRDKLFKEEKKPKTKKTRFKADDFKEQKSADQIALEKIQDRLIAGNITDDEFIDNENFLRDLSKKDTVEGRAVLKALEEQFPEGYDPANPGDFGMPEDFVEPEPETREEHENKQDDIPPEDVDELLFALKGTYKGEVYSTLDAGDITGENAGELFNRMNSLSRNYYDSKEAMDEHTSVLNEVMGIVSEGFEVTRGIQLTEEQIEGITQGTYEVESERMTLSFSQGSPVTRNGMSPQEVYAHEMVHGMTAIAVNEKPLVADRIEKLYAHVHKSLGKEYGKGNEWKVFRPAGTGPTSLATAEEIDMAKKQYNHAFNAREEDRLIEFLAYSGTNKQLIAFMTKNPVGQREGLMGKLMDVIQAVVNTVKELLGYKVYRAQNSSSLAEALAIMEHLVAIQNKHKSKHAQRQSKTYKFLDKSDQIVRDFSDRVGLNIRRKTMQAISEETKDGKRRMKSGMTNVLTTYATGIINVPHITLSNHASVQIHRMGLMSTLNHALRGVANEVGGGALSNELKEQLLNAKITISKLRQETERFYIDWFNNAWKSMSPDELENGAMSFETREALTDVILRTDLASLRLTSGLGLNGPGSTQKIMNLIGKDNNAVAQRGTLKKTIKQKLNLTANDPAIAYADELGHWIATGHTERISGAYNSAASIAFDHLEDPTEEQVGWLDAFATLVALDDVDERKIALVQGLSKNEFNANATDNGIIDLLDTHIHYKTESREELFDGDAVPMMKGYIVERMDNLTDIKIKPAADKERMADAGYAHSYPISTTDKDQTHDTMYINRNMPEVSDISGIMSTTNQRNMGTTLTEILMKNPKYIDPVTNKPNFGQVKNTIDRFKTDQAALAKQLKIDPRFKFRPVRHPETNVITDFRIMMDHKSTKELLRPDLEFQNVFAHMQSRLIDRKNTIKNDIETVNLLVHEQADLLKVHPEQFIDLLDPDGPYIDRYRKLPKAVREYIQEFAKNDTFMVRHDIVEKVFGFKQLDITQLGVFQGDHPLQLRAKQIAGLTHYAVRQTVGYGKNRIVLAMPEVVFGNMFSNVAQLSMRKISLPYIINKVIEGIHEYRKYSRDSQEIAKLQHLINTKKLDKQKSPEALKVARLKVRLKRNKLDKMVKAGLDSLIVEDLNEAQIDGYFNRMKRVLFKGALKDVGGKIPKSLQTIASTLFWAKGSIGYNFSRQMVQMTDFLGRYVMIEHAMAIQGHTFKRAMHDALDAFVLFDESLIASLEALEMTGATAFLSYWLRNQRSSRQLLQASPTAVGISAALQYSTGVATLGNVNSSWLGGDFSPNLMQFPNLFDEANNLTGFEIGSDIMQGGLYKGLLN